MRVPSGNSNDFPLSTPTSTSAELSAPPISPRSADRLMPSPQVRSLDPFQASVQNRSIEEVRTPSRITPQQLFNTTPEPEPSFMRSPARTLSHTTEDEIANNLHNFNLEHDTVSDMGNNVSIDMGALRLEDLTGSTEGPDNVSSSHDTSSRRSETSFENHEPSRVPTWEEAEAISLPAYSLDDEVLPKGPFHRNNFQTSIHSGINLAADIKTCLASCEAAHGPDSSLRSLLQNATRLSQYAPPSSRTIGVVGESGHGSHSSPTSRAYADVPI